MCNGRAAQPENPQVSGSSLTIEISRRRNWRDGLAVVEVLMACYKSAEERRTIDFPVDLAGFVPAVARGEWRG